MKKIKIYTTTYCPFCVKAKELLKKKNIKFQEINLIDHPEELDEMIKKSKGARTVPQIFADDNHIGDCDYIHQLDRENKLDNLLGIKK